MGFEHQILGAGVACSSHGALPTYPSCSCFRRSSSVTSHPPEPNYQGADPSVPETLNPNSGGAAITVGNVSILHKTAELSLLLGSLVAACLLVGCGVAPF